MQKGGPKSVLKYFQSLKRRVKYWWISESCSQYIGHQIQIISDQSMSENQVEEEVRRKGRNKENIENENKHVEIIHSRHLAWNLLQCNKQICFSF